MPPREISAIATHPVFFQRNRVFRVYRGGKLFHEFFGDPAEDGNHPEEWIASAVRALNDKGGPETEGLSLVEGSDLDFASLLAAAPELMTGGAPFAVLVKALDSAIRLPAQTHPDKAFSRIHFKSDFGKTEMWLVLATRPGANLYFGFKEGVTRAALERAVSGSETDPNAFTALLQEVPAKAGDVWLIPARVAHAIGAGCLILEVQEPSDFTIQPERWCGDYRLSDEEMYLGLDPSVALDCFDLGATGPAVIARGRRKPVIAAQNKTVVKENLITYQDTPCFAVNRYTIREGEFTLEARPAIFVVVSGQGELRAETRARPIKRGDYFFLPAAAKPPVVAAGNELVIVECLPPQSSRT